MSEVKVSSKAGIVESKTGERHIPSSIRADGTKRKEIKIRPGYKPIEDIEVYRNRYAQSYKSLDSKEVPGTQGLEETKSPSLVINKNAKKRAAKKKSKTREENLQDGPCIKEAGQMTQDSYEFGIATEKTHEALEIEREKKTRSLKKKLKQARELEDKKKNGSNLLPEQVTKILRINELIRELNVLELQSKVNETQDNEKVG
ncbi:putative rna binding protein pym [Erysiphe necator]|uniref:Putative rna binding protein pym n=1 Tax=Uncinula necator TaxID=52586 RepID=A0A0B1PDD2_UNCNE|nr:putative rna binding protein pym [Erysiphe necator]